MRDNALEYLRLVRICAHISIQILQLDFLAPEIVVEPIEFTALVLISSFILKGMCLDTFSHLRRVFVKNAPHLVLLCLINALDVGGFQDDSGGEWCAPVSNIDHRSANITR